MVGGSVNGRPFREDAHSYLRTGLPCGNPQRFRSRAVVHMVPVPNSILEDQCLDVPPTEKTETEGERQFKRILDKQLNTEMTIKDVMKQSRDFTKSLDYHSLTEKISGAMPLKDFQAIKQKKEDCDRLQEFGLNQEEIKLHLDMASDEKTKINPEILQGKLKVIDEKIQAKKIELEKPTQFRDVHYLTRHEMEIERTLKPNCSHAHFLQKLMTTEKPSAVDVHPDDPINHLKELEKDMFGHLKKNKRKRRKLHHNKKRFIDHSAFEQIALPVANIKNDVEGRVSSSVDKIGSLPNKTNEREIGCSLSINTEPQTEMMVHLSSVNSWLTDDEIRKDKLSVEEIRNIPKFADYSPGTESKVLYIKNLGKNVQVLDLMALFGRFTTNQKSSPCIKLMQGRMRGQAFVSFEDGATASKAMELINGFQMKGKPLIISYGKQNLE